LKVADFHLKADAAAAVVGLLERTAAKPGFRTAAVAVRMKEAPGDDFVFPEESETLDPRVFMAEIDAVLPRSWSIIASTGHSFYFSAALMRDRPPELFHTILDFGAIGSNLAYAAGIAAAQGDGKVVVFDGDGSFLMQVQELETIKRHGLRLLICVLNDGAYGAELHKLEAQGVDAGETIFGRPRVADIAAAFGLRSATVRTTGELAALFDDHLRSSGAEVWDIHVSRTVVSPYYRHEHWSEAQVKEDASRP
jgi:thiamine pyrophosphate-dependent acetolactate synthase large subunit-like protein